MWVGYDLAGIDDDLSAAGFIKVDGWTDEQIGGYGVTSFTRVEPEDEATLRKLGIERKR